MAYCTVAEVKDREIVAGIADVQYQSAIDWAEALLDKLTNDHFEPTILSLRISGSGSYRQNFYPGTYLRCLSITSITDVPSGDVVTSAEYLAKDHFMVLLEDYVVRAGSGNSVWPRGIYNLAVVGSFGWSAVPDPIRDATILLCLAKVKNLSSSATVASLKSERIGDYSYTTSDTGKTKTGIGEVDEVIDMYMNNFIGLEAV